jgi:excisionase family DNA binding protein
MLTVEQVAEILNVAKITIFRHLKTGQIKGVKIGNVWRISVEEVERIKKEGV